MHGNLGRALGLALMLLGVGMSALRSQPPALPAINPATARLDQTVGGLGGPGLALAFDEAGGLLLAGNEAGALHYWYKDVALGVRSSERSPHTVAAHKGPVLAVAAAGGTVASAGADGKVLLWSLPAEKVLHTCETGGVVRAVAVSPDGKVVAGTGDDGTVQLWDAASGKAVQKLVGGTDWLRAVAFSPDGKSIASGGYDGTVRVCEPTTGRKLVEWKAQGAAPPGMPPPPASAVSALAFAPDGKTLAVGGTDGQIHLFQSADGKPVRSFPGHTSGVSGLAFHPGGTVLASSSRDRTVRLWNPANGQPVKVLEGHSAWAEGVVWLAQGTRLASVGADQTVRFWDLTEPKK
jgi:WD40 repeat protein